MVIGGNMESRFIDTMDYIRDLKERIKSEDEISINDKIVLIIQEAILSNKHYMGSIILTKSYGEFTISNIQKHSYAWKLNGEKIDIQYVLIKCMELGIDTEIKYHPIGDNINDYEFIFLVNMDKKIKTRRIS